MPVPKQGETQEQFMQRCIPQVKTEGVTQEQAVAICLSKYKDTPDATLGRDTQKRIAFDKATLNDKIKTDTDTELTIPAIIASEIVQQYDDGYAYKPADELKKMAEIAQLIGAVPVKILEHPGASTNYLLLKHGDVNGKATNFEFVKNLPDPKTGRPMRRGVKTDITWIKHLTPEDTINRMIDGELRDVSIGFTFDSDRTSGVWQGQNYDYVQRNIFLNHVAAPIPKGRCAGPLCGIGFDANLKFGIDTPTLNNCPVCRTIIAVGLERAARNLAVGYGSGVIDVIQGKMVPQEPKAKVEVDENDLTRRFNNVFTELQSRLI